MRETILEILTDIRPDVDFEANKQLIDNGILESFDIVTLVSELSEEFDITISPKELVAANFNSVETLCEMVTRLQGE